MATTTDIQKKAVSKITWKNQTYKWTDSEIRSRSWNETRIYTWIASVKSTLNIAEQPSLGLSRGFDEILKLRDDAKKQFGLNVLRKLAVAETLNGFEIGQSLSDSFGFKDQLSNDVARAFASTLQFVEARFQKALNKQVATNLAVIEERSTNFKFKVSEIVKIATVGSKRPIKGFSSKFGITSYHGKGYSVNNMESITMKDAIDRQIAFIRTLIEEMGIADLPSNFVQSKLTEELKVLDAFLRKADMALADMVLSTLASGEDINLEAFENLVTNGAMPGYTNWRDFIPGDYEYTKALFRVIIESSTADRAQIQQLDVAVDVPDVNDRGTVTVTNATTGGVVEYNRFYHVIPDVTVSAKGGLTHPTVPEFLVAPNLTGFTVRLRDTITGDYVTGSFTWSAHGY